MNRLINSNRAMKGIAFLIALMLWMIVTLDEQSRSSVQPDEEQLIWNNVTVEAVYDEEKYTLLRMDDSVQVVLTGPRTVLNLMTLRRDAFRLYVDLTDLGPGGHRVPVQHQGFPEQVGVTIIPRSIYVELDKNETRRFDVQIELVGQHPDGFRVGQPEFSPALVEVTAARSVLDTVQKIRGRIDLGHISRDGREKVRLEAVGPQGEPLDVRIEPEVLEVRVPLQAPSKEVPVALELANELPRGYSLENVSLETEFVKVFAPQSILDELDQVVVTLDLSAITENQIVSLDFEKERRWIEVQPERIRARVQIGPTRERLFTGIPIRMTGLADGYEAKILSPPEGRMQIAVLGSEGRLEELKRSEVRPWINLEGLGPGRHQVPVHADLPPYLKADVDGLNVQVEIRALD